MPNHGFNIPREKVADFCRKHHIRRLSLFGSILRDDFGPESDIDMLVEYEPGATPSLMRCAGQEIELSAILGRKVDLRTQRDLSKYFRDEVARNAEPLELSATQGC
jgi:uncharacterized protein